MEYLSLDIMFYTIMTDYNNKDIKTIFNELLLSLKNLKQLRIRVEYYYGYQQLYEHNLL